jgi:hypothetical protein
MKVLIQNPLTLSYFETDHKWTHDVDAALDFKDSRSAVRYCSEHDLLDMEIVLKFPQDRYDVHMPAWAAAPASAHERPLAAASHFAA